MTIEQTDKVDGMGIDRSANELVLLISDHLLWHEEETHLSSLEKKLGAYLAFISSRQYLETLPQARDLPIRIRLLHEHVPTVSAQETLRSVEERLLRMGIRFSYGSLPEKT